LPVLLKEFREKREMLQETFRPMIESFYESEQKELNVHSDEIANPRITVQGGIGTHGEMKRLLDEYEMDGTGWGSPFLLVPEATCVDDETSGLLANAGQKDLYLSNVSPLGVPFNNVRGTGSEKHTRELVEKGKPGSKCPKGFLVSNTEFTEKPICTASAEYQLLKINSIQESDLPDDEKEKQTRKVTEKTCLCTNLGTGSMIRLGIMKPSYGRQAICPGPNIAWFNRHYSLEEMVNHIYGRGKSLVPNDRPHMFAKELVMYVDYISELSLLTDPDDKEWKTLLKMRKNLEEGMELCSEIAKEMPYEGENLQSLDICVREQQKRLEELFAVSV